jgi:molecular chaperone HscB
MSAPIERDYFAALGLAPGFAIDAATVERAFHERSRTDHPDRFAAAPPAERAVAAQRFAVIRDAYQTLRLPAKRAEYLLARDGVVIGEHERLDLAFLGEVLELREELAGALATHDDAKVAALEAAMKVRHQALVAQLAPAFDAIGRGGDAAIAARAAAKKVLVALRYVQRYLEECDRVDG